jgi:hypothetical protein
VGDKEKPKEFRTEDSKGSKGKSSWDHEWILRVS